MMIHTTYIQINTTRRSVRSVVHAVVAACTIPVQQVHQHLFDLCVTRLGRTTNRSRNLLVAILLQYLIIIIIIIKCTRSKQARYPVAQVKI